jgi:hypothetical protein
MVKIIKTNKVMDKEFKVRTLKVILHKVLN